MNTSKKAALTVTISEKAIKSIQHVHHLREEINHLATDFLDAAKKGKFEAELFSGLKASANELKDSIKKIKKHIGSSAPVIVKPAKAKKSVKGMPQQQRVLSKNKNR